MGVRACVQNTFSFFDFTQNILIFSSLTPADPLPVTLLHSSMGTLMCTFIFLEVCHFFCPCFSDHFENKFSSGYVVSHLGRIVFFMSEVSACHCLSQLPHGCFIFTPHFWRIGPLRIALHDDDGYSRASAILPGGAERGTPAIKVAWMLTLAHFMPSPEAMQNESVAISQSHVEISYPIGTCAPWCRPHNTFRPRLLRTARVRTSLSAAVRAGSPGQPHAGLCKSWPRTPNAFLRS